MASRFLGYLTDHRLALYEAGPAGWKFLREFDESQASELPDHLDRNMPLHLLADLVEMEFRFEKAIFLRGSDRRAFHDRKLQQAFRNTPFRHAFALGRDPGRRGEERLLLSAITNPELVTPWLSALRQRRLPLSGIACVPMLQKLLVRPLAIDDPHVLLLTAQRQGGIRITYFFEKEVRFSRLAVHAGDLAALGNTAFEEAVRTHQYLLSLRLVERSSPVEVVCLLPEKLIAPWRVVQSSSGSLRFSHLSLADAARLAGIRDENAGRNADNLFIGLLAKARFPNHFAPSPDRHGFHLHWLRRALLAGSGALALGSAAASSTLAYNAWNHLQAAREAQASTLALDADIQRARDSFPKTTVPVEEIREALDLTRNLQRESAPARRLLADLSRGFDAVAQAELHALAWTRSEHPERFSDEANTGDTPTADTGTTAGSSQAGGGGRWVAVLRGEIVGADSYRQANGATEALARAIRRDGIAVEILEYPLNIRPDAELKDNFDPAVPRRLPFKLRVIWNP